MKDFDQYFELLPVRAKVTLRGKDITDMQSVINGLKLGIISPSIIKNYGDAAHIEVVKVAILYLEASPITNGE
jgi:hypothetical protein